MKKTFTFLFAALLSVCMFASIDVVPSNELLADYYEPGNVCVCFFVPADMSCNDIVVTGSFNNWSSDPTQCLLAEPVVGYDGWYVASFEPEDEPDEQNGMMVKPVMLEYDGSFSWYYQTTAATVIRGAVQVVPGALAGDINIINCGTNAPNVFTVDAWMQNPCTAIYHNYTITVVSDGCGGYVVPFLVGNMTGWDFQQMQLDVDATIANDYPTYSISFRAPEGTPYQIVSGLMDDTGEIETMPTWADEAYLQKNVNGEWVRYMGEYDDNQLTGSDPNIVYDLRSGNLRWARCVELPQEHVVIACLFPLSNAPGGVEIIGSFNGGEGIAMERHDNGWWFAELDVKASQYFKFRSAGSWRQELEIYNVVDDTWNLIADNQLVFDQIWYDANWNGAEVKMIELDFSDPEYYHWSGSSKNWSLDPNTGVLVIFGSGSMEDYNYGDAPWFSNKSSITSVIIGDSITSIGDNAFYGCTGLTSVTIGNSVTRIGQSAFSGCTSLTSLTIPDSVTNIGIYAFKGCTGLTSVTIPNNVTNIEDGTFYGCSSLTSTTIPDSVTNIGQSAFYGCSSLTSMTIPNSVTSIGQSTFYGCTGLTSITIPNSITSIEKEAFYRCASLASIAFPDSITKIGERAFVGCGSLTSVRIPLNVTNIGSNAFAFCNSLDSVIWEARSCDDLSVSGIYDEDLELYLLDVGVFPSIVKSIVFGNEVEYIPAYLCYPFIELLSIEIPQSVRNIGNNAFKGCSNLTSVIWNAKSCAGFAEYEKAPFYEMRKNITSFVFGDNVKSIPARLCAGMSNAGNIVIPPSVTYIGAGAFNSCSGLTSISIPNISSIKEETFSNCIGLTSIDIPSSVRSIEDYAFYYCSGLTTVTIPNGVISLGEGAFMECTNITSVTIPESVTTLGIAATFQGCPRIKEVHWNAENCEILYDSKEKAWYPPFYEADSIEHFVFGENVERIPELLCAGAKLNSIVIPNKVLSIGKGAFQNCTLSNVILGSRVKEIEDNAFYGNSLDTITSYAKRVPTVGTQAFDGTNTSYCILYVLAEYMNAYETDNFWGDFIDIRPIGANPTQTVELVVTPSDNTAKVVWPEVSGAVSYELLIVDRNATEICTLIFNAYGQLTSIAFRAPSMSNAPMQTQAAGFEFTVTGLEEGSSYDLTMTSKDSNGATLQTETVSFTTTIDGESIEPEKDYTPTNLYAVQTEKDGHPVLHFTWDAVEEVGKYEIKVTRVDYSIPMIEEISNDFCSTNSYEVQFDETEYEPGTYTVNWGVRSLDSNYNVLSDWTNSTVQLIISDRSEGMDNVTMQHQSSKRFHDGQILIQRGNKTYTLTGQEVR